MGGFSDVILISFRSKKPIKSVLTTSRSGNHGRRSYRLFPGRYILILNKDVLPLWDRVFPFDYHEDRGQDNQEEE